MESPLDKMPADWRREFYERLNDRAWRIATAEALRPKGAYIASHPRPSTTPSTAPGGADENRDGKVGSAVAGSASGVEKGPRSATNTPGPDKRSGLFVADRRPHPFTLREQGERP